PTLVSEPVDGDDWVHEIKLDGYRILCRKDGGAATLTSRNGKDWTAAFPEVARDAAALPCERALVDGEVAALLPDGSCTSSSASSTSTASTSRRCLFTRGRKRSAASSSTRRRASASATTWPGTAPASSPRPAG